MAIPEEDAGEPQVVGKEARPIAIPKKDDDEPLVVLDSRTGKRLSPCTKTTPCKVEVKLNKNGEPFLVDRQGKPIRDAKVVKLYRFRYPGSECEVWYYGYWYYNHCGQVALEKPWGPAQGPPEPRPPTAP